MDILEIMKERHSVRQYKNQANQSNLLRRMEHHQGQHQVDHSVFVKMIIGKVSFYSYFYEVISKQ